MPIGKRVIIIGGLIQGSELAEFLVKRGRKVTIVETSDEIGTGIPERRRLRLIAWLNKKGVSMLTGVKYESISDGGLTLVTKDGKRRTIEADNILIAVPLKPNHQLFEALRGKVPAVHMIGDSAEPRRIIDAVNDGCRVGLSV